MMINITVEKYWNGNDVAMLDEAKHYTLPLKANEWDEVRELWGLDEDEAVEYDVFKIDVDSDFFEYIPNYTTLQELHELQSKANGVDVETLKAVLDADVELSGNKLEAAIEAIKAGQFFFDKVTPVEYAKGRYEIANDVPMGCEEEFKAYNGDYQKMFDEQYSHECVVINDGVLYGPALDECL